MSEKLERRYRRLLAWYPENHREEYGDEMLAVLLTGAAEGQTRPRFGETVDVLRAALSARVATGSAALKDRRWADASGALSVLVPLALLAAYLGPMLARAVWQVRTEMVTVAFGFRPHVWVVTLVLLTMAVAALLGRRVIAALAAWAVTGLLATQAAITYVSYPVDMLQMVPVVVLVAVTAAALTVSGVGRGGLATLGHRQTIWYVLALLLVGLTPAITPLTARIEQFPGGYSAMLWPGGLYFMDPVLSRYTNGDGLSFIAVPVLLVAAILGLTALARTAGPVRRRLVVAVAPAVSMVPLIDTGFAGYMVSTVRFDPPVPLVTGQWVVLAVAPLLVFAIGAAWVQRHESTLQLVELGRAARRAARKTTDG
ncbi:hypothetical protein GCM10009682_39090 [Luedemannella flava]|uniref:Uncharacterized protein n=1 Tax=Luedemannella flava TaxID=349316 RepID=A0ABN2MB81_9ACTN